MTADGVESISQIATPAEEALQFFFFFFFFFKAALLTITLACPCHRSTCLPQTRLQVHFTLTLNYPAQSSRTGVEVQ